MKGYDGFVVILLSLASVMIVLGADMSNHGELMIAQWKRALKSPLFYAYILVISAILLIVNGIG